MFLSNFGSSSQDFRMSVGFTIPAGSDKVGGHVGDRLEIVNDRVQSERGGANRLDPLMTSRSRTGAARKLIRRMARVQLPFQRREGRVTSVAAAGLAGTDSGTGRRFAGTVTHPLTASGRGGGGHHGRRFGQTGHDPRGRNRSRPAGCWSVCWAERKLFL